MKALAAILGILVLIIVGSVSLGIMSNVAPPSSAWEYDDYRPIENATGATGSLEVVETYLGPMVHAHDVGPGTITYADHEEHVTVYPAKLDVFLMTGQSNSISLAGSYSEASPVPGLGEAYAWVNNDGFYGKHGDWPAANTMRPMRNLDGTSSTFDKAPPFAATYNEITGHKVYWICGGWSGLSITNFDPSGSVVWDFMSQTVTEAMEAVDTRLFDVSSEYWMWIQGEADAEMDISEYKSRFMALNDAINDGSLDGLRFSHCFIALITSQYGGNAREAQIQLAEEHPKLITIATDVADTFTVENGMIHADQVHWTQKGDNLVGVALGDACGNLYDSEHPGQRERATLLSLVPIIMAILIPIMAIGLALRAIMGRD